MSDPVTNVEIEDVLTSIRRLVSDGDKARTRDPAPVEGDADPAPEAPVERAEAPESKPDRFVLTPALMVVANESVQKSQMRAKIASDDVADDPTVENNEDDQDAGWVEELPDEPVPPHDDVIRQDDADEIESDFEADKQDEDAASQSGEKSFEADSGDMIDSSSDEDDDPDHVVWGSVDEARKIGLAAVPESVAKTSDLTKPTDRSGLIASIAELEAAVSKDSHDFEPDGSEAADEMMGETIAWPGTAKRNTANAQDAEEAGQPDTDAPEVDLVDDDADEPETVTFEHRAETAEEAEQDTEVEHSDDQADDYDDDLDGLLDAGTVNLDEEALRALVSEVVREELTGPMGERITRNVRKLVRREIYRILSSQEFD